MKKFIYCFLILFVSSMVLVPKVDAAVVAPDVGGGTTKPVIDVGTFDPDRDDRFEKNCEDFAKTIRIGGYLLFLVKVMLPIIIIVKATMSFVSIVTSGKPDELKKKANKLMTSLIAAIIIFFLPTIVYTVFSFIQGFDENRTDDSKICSACIFDPFSSDCSTYANAR